MKPRGKSGSRTRKMITPTDTTMNAVSVPMDTMSASFSSGMKAASADAAMATITVLLTGVIVRVFTRANRDGSSPSRPIAKRMRVCPYMRDQRDGEDRDHGARSQNRAGPAAVRDVVEDGGQPGLLLPGEVLPRLGAQRGQRDEHVHAGDGHQRRDQRARHGLLRILHLVARGRHRIKADVREEDGAGRRADARDAERGKVVEMVRRRRR